MADEPVDGPRADDAPECGIEARDDIELRELVGVVEVVRDVGAEIDLNSNGVFTEGVLFGETASRAEALLRLRSSSRFDPRPPIRHIA